MKDNSKILIFMLLVIAVSSVGLAGLFTATNDMAILNERIFNKKAMLSAVDDYMPDNAKANQLSNDEVTAIFSDENRIEQFVLNMNGEMVEDVLVDDIDMAKEQKKPEAERLLPVVKYKSGDEEFFILSVRGKGLWDDIWGSIALKSDMNTIAGVSFDHKGETPGLGAEIKDNKAWGEQFKEKKIYNNDGEFVSIGVIKGGAKDPVHEVDGISGATITANGVAEMLERGLKYYEPFLEKMKNK